FWGQVSFAGRQPTQSPVEVSQTLPAGLFAQSASPMQGIGTAPPAPLLPLLLLAALALRLIPPPVPRLPAPDGVPPPEPLGPFETPPPQEAGEAARRPMSRG